MQRAPHTLPQPADAGTPAGARTAGLEFVTSTPDLIGRLGRELLSLAAVLHELDPDDRRIAVRSVADAADCLIPAIQAMRSSAPNRCIQIDVTVHGTCDHPGAHRD